MIDINNLRKIGLRQSSDEDRELLYEVADFLEKIKEKCGRLEEHCATLTDALRSTAQTLAWMQHGKCRGFSDDLLTTNEALDKARAALENLK